MSLPLSRALLGAFILCAGVCAQSTAWTGSRSNDWHDPGNWTAGVPDSNTDAIIGTLIQGPSLGSVDGSCRVLEVGALSVLTIPGGTRLEVFADLNGLLSQVAGGGTVALVGDTARKASLSGDASLRIEGSGSVVAQSIGIDGDLVQTPGAGPLTLEAGGSAVVGGDLTLEGPGFASTTGSLRVDGTTRIAPEAPTTLAPGVIVARGDFEGGDNFQPASGTVEFTGSGPRQANGTLHRVVIAADVDLSWPVTSLAGSLSVFGNLRISEPSVLLDIGGDLTVDGLLEAPLFRILRVGGDVDFRPGSELQASEAVMDVAGDLLLRGTAALGDGDHRIGGDLEVNENTVFGSPSRIRLFSTEDKRVRGTGTLPLVEVTGSGRVVFEGELRVERLRQLIGGGLMTTFPETTEVVIEEDLDIEGQGISGVFQVLGDVHANPLSNENAFVSVQVAGDWIGAPGYEPTQGTVVFNGDDPQSIVGTLPSVVVENPQLRWDEPRLTGDLRIAAEGVLESWATELLVPRQLVVTGTLLMPHAERIVVGGSSNLAVNATGSIIAPQAALQASGGVGLFAAGTELGSGPHRMWGDISIVGNVRLPQDAVIELNGGVPTRVWLGSVPNLRITGPGPVTLSDQADVRGDLHQAPGAGPLFADEIRVFGDLDLRGAGFSPSTELVVDGDCHIDPEEVSPHAPNLLEVGGSWLSSERFQPSRGLVRIHGAGLRTLQVEGSLHDLEIGWEASVDWEGDLLVTGDVTVLGALRVNAGATLDCAAETELSIALGAALRMLGSVDEPATLLAPPLGRVSVAGSVVARNFAIERLPATGLELNVTGNAVIRDGILRSSVATAASEDSVMLDVRANVASTLRNLRFEDAGGRTRFNVRASQFSQPLTIVNASGNRAGPTFEDDPFDRIEWVEEPDETQLIQLQATGMLARVELEFETAFEVDVEFFEWRRSTSPDGPYINLAGRLMPAGNGGQGARYLLEDNPFSPVRWWYRLEEQTTDGLRRVLGTRSVVPLEAEFGDTVVVGRDGTYPDVDSALAVVPEGGTILVESGIYPTFTVSKSVRIVARETAAVSFDGFGLSKVSVRDLPENGFVSLVGLNLSPAGLEILDCAGSVYVDQLTLNLPVASTLVVQDSQQVVLQSCGLHDMQLQGETKVSMARSEIDGTASLEGGSTLIYADSELTPSQLVLFPGATATALEGTSPRLDASHVLGIGNRITMRVEADPGALYWVFLAGGVDFVELDSILPIDMVLLLDPNLGLRPFLGGTIPPSGQETVLSPRIDEPALIGLSAPLQILTGDGVSFRFGNLHEVVFLP